MVPLLGTDWSSWLLAPDWLVFSIVLLCCVFFSFLLYSNLALFMFTAWSVWKAHLYQLCGGPYCNCWICAGFWWESSLVLWPRCGLPAARLTHVIYHVILSYQLISSLPLIFFTNFQDCQYCTNGSMALCSVGCFHINLGWSSTEPPGTTVLQREQKRIE